MLLLAFAACAGPTPKNRANGFQPPTAVASSVTLAPPAMDPDIEIGELARFQTTPVLLRIAFLELLQKRPDRALDATAEVLYARTKPSTNEESFARYLRAEAYTQAGKPGLGQSDRERAAGLATDPELRRRLAAAAPRDAAEPAPDPDLVVQPRSAWQAQAPDRGNVEPMARIDRVIRVRRSTSTPRPRRRCWRRRPGARCTGGRRCGWRTRPARPRRPPRRRPAW